jgi:hypothetical protein
MNLQQKLVGALGCALEHLDPAHPDAVSARAVLAEYDAAIASEPPKVRKVCGTCGSENVLRDAFAEWDFAAQEWTLQNVFDDAVCEDCDGETDIEDEEVTQRDAAPSAQDASG